MSSATKREAALRRLAFEITDAAVFEAQADNKHTSAMLFDVGKRLQRILGILPRAPRGKTGAPADSGE